MALRWVDQSQRHVPLFPRQTMYHLRVFVYETARRDVLSSEYIRRTAEAQDKVFILGLLHTPAHASRTPFKYSIAIGFNR